MWNRNKYHTDDDDDNVGFADRRQGVGGEHHETRYLLWNDNINNDPYQPLLQSEEQQQQQQQRDPLLLLKPSSLPLLQQQEENEEEGMVSVSFQLLLYGYSYSGFIMLLPNIATLYYINTYLSIPITLLPIYTSITFLPYSLKPIYAYLSTTIDTSVDFHKNKTNNNKKKNGIFVLLRSYIQQRSIQITILLCISSIGYIGTALFLTVSSSSSSQHSQEKDRLIIIFMIIAYIQSTCIAWSNFLLDLCLLDKVATTSPRPTTTTKSEMIAIYQSQAATYRSIGCIVANVFIVLCFYCVQNISSLYYHYYRHHYHPHFQYVATTTSGSMTHAMFQLIYIFTGTFNILCAIIIVLWNYYDSSTICNDQIPKQEAASTDMNPGVNVIQTRRLPSYDSISDEDDPLLVQKDESQRSNSFEIDLLSPLPPTKDEALLVSTTDCSDDNNYINNSTHLTNNQNNIGIWLIVMIQILVIHFTMRPVMIHLMTMIGWICITILLFIILGFLLWIAIFPYSTVLSSISIFYNRNHNNNENDTSNNNIRCLKQIRVGIYLILRYSIPSCSYIMTSYLYTIYEHQPYIIQLLSLCDMFVTTIACYTYSKYLSPYSSTEIQLYCLMAITTALAGIASFGNVLLIHILNPKHTTTSDNNTTEITVTKIMLTIVINAVIGICNEWKFIPDVVLATTSSSGSSGSCVVNDNHEKVAPETQRTQQHCSTLPLINIGYTIPDVAYNGEEHCLNDTTQPLLPSNAVPSSSPTTATATATTTTTTAIQYGTLLSCIDFGDQMGIILTGLLIHIFHIHRDYQDTSTDHNNNDNNDTSTEKWYHLQELQIMNSIFILLSIGLIGILPQSETKNCTKQQQQQQ